MPKDKGAGILTPEKLTLMAEKDLKQKTKEEILEMFSANFTIDTIRRRAYADNKAMFDKGVDLADDEFGTHKVTMQFPKRMCKTHASYIFKERPNIQVPAIDPEVPESNAIAANIERVLNLWWDEQDITKKVKQGILQASIKGDHIFYLAVDNEEQTVSFNSLNAEYFTYDTVSRDPDSPIIWTLRGDMMGVRELKKAFPAFSEQITPTSSCKAFTTLQGFSASDIYNTTRAFYYEIMDGKYLYRYINDIEVEVVEHGYPFITYYLFKYFDFGGKYGAALLEFIKDPIKFIGIMLGYKADIALMASNPTLIVTGSGNATLSLDGKSVRGGRLDLPMGAIAQYLQPPQSPIDMNNLVEIMKSFMHFLSGLSEEAMAGFTGSLTSAGVSIELRLDSTVREALDTQITLQSLLQRINRDYLRLNEHFFPTKNLLYSKAIGYISSIGFRSNEIGGTYYNIVDFGGVLPRSQDQIVRNVLAKHQSGLISKNTALEELRYMDPSTELNKLRNEFIETSKDQQQVARGERPPQEYFQTPKEEEAYIFSEEKMPLVHPTQDHKLHLNSHILKAEKVKHPLLIQHIAMHKNFIKEERKA